MNETPTPPSWNDSRAQLATQKRVIPNVMVTNHLGEERAFYDDLVRDKIVLLHLTSVHHDSQYPVARNLTRIQDALAKRIPDRALGREMFIYSISVQPLIDTPARLRTFARRHRARLGWQFLTGEPAAIEMIRSSLFVHSTVGQAPLPAGREQLTRLGCSLGLMRYGNDRIGLWGSVPGKASPEMVAERISWLLPRGSASKPTTAGKLSRGGPYPNRQFQTQPRTWSPSASGIPHE